MLLEFDDVFDILADYFIYKTWGINANYSIEQHSRLHNDYSIKKLQNIDIVLEKFCSDVIDPSPDPPWEVFGTSFQGVVFLSESKSVS